MTKNTEMKWVVTKGNENLSIKPLSFLGNMRRPVWVADRGVGVPVDLNGSGSSLECQRVDHRKLDKRVRSLSKTFQQLPLLFHYAYRKCLTLTTMPVPPSSVQASGETLLRLSINDLPGRSSTASPPTHCISRRI